jgi:hypothetical protein
LNRKPARQHSSLSRASLRSQHLTLNLNRKSPDLIGDSFKIYLEHDARTYGRAG